MTTGRFRMEVWKRRSWIELNAGLTNVVSFFSFSIGVNGVPFFNFFFRLAYQNTGGSK